MNYQQTTRKSASSPPPGNGAVKPVRQDPSFQAADPAPGTDEAIQFPFHEERHARRKLSSKSTPPALAQQHHEHAGGARSTHHLCMIDRQNGRSQQVKACSQNKGPQVLLTLFRWTSSSDSSRHS
eukprot:768087-Hanusia_phi.AAC.3